MKRILIRVLEEEVEEEEEVGIVEGIVEDIVEEAVEGIAEDIGEEVVEEIVDEGVEEMEEVGVEEMEEVGVEVEEWIERLENGKMMIIIRRRMMKRRLMMKILRKAKKEEEKEESSESSEYYPEGMLIENKTENKLVDTPIKEHSNKPKGFKHYLESTEKQKEEVEKLLETKGISTKNEDIVGSNVEVVTMNKKDKPIELENKNDNYFFKSEQEQQQEQEQTKKKRNKQGPKSIPVSDVLHFKSKRHKGFNTVREDKDKFKRRDSQPQENGGETRTHENEERNTNESKENREPQDNGGDNRYQNYDDRQYWNKPQGRNNRRVNIESTKQFPPLSGNIIPQSTFNWGPNLGQN